MAKQKKFGFNRNEIREQVSEDAFNQCNADLLLILGENGGELKNAIEKLNNWKKGIDRKTSIYTIYDEIIDIYKKLGYESEVENAITYCKEKFDEEYEEELERLRNEFEDDESNQYNDPEYRWRNNNGYDAAIRNLEHDAAFIASSNLSLPEDSTLNPIIKESILGSVYYDVACSYGLTR